MNILVTGGAGYIGSHTLVELYKAGHTAVVVDNLCNSNPEAIRRVSAIVGCEIPFVRADTCMPQPSAETLPYSPKWSGNRAH